MKINFKFSPPYERALTGVIESPKDSLLRVKIKAMKSFWLKKGPVIEKVLLDITSLSFERSETVDCFINSKASLSLPLSLRIGKISYMQDTLIHELIHVLFYKNGIFTRSSWKRYLKKYSKEHLLTRNHILLHAVHQILAKRITPSRVASIEKVKNPHYQRAWQIVNQVEAQKLVDTYLKNK